jgi:hypothetical protein
VELDPVGRPAPRRPLLRRPGVLIVAALGVGGVVVALSSSVRHAIPGLSAPPPAGGPSIARVVPDTVRVKVEVLNGTDTRGLARSAAGYLRDAGFDVVYFGNTTERFDSTVVRDRTGHTSWATMARNVMQPARTEVSADSTRLVDLTVVVGSLWRPPPDPFRP